MGTTNGDIFCFHYWDIHTNAARATKALSTSFRSLDEGVFLKTQVSEDLTKVLCLSVHPSAHSFIRQVSGMFESSRHSTTWSTVAAFIFQRALTVNYILTSYILKPLLSTKLKYLYFFLVHGNYNFSLLKLVNIYFKEYLVKFLSCLENCSFINRKLIEHHSIFFRIWLGVFTSQSVFNLILNFPIRTLLNFFCHAVKLISLYDCYRATSSPTGQVCSVDVIRLKKTFFIETLGIFFKS